MEAISEAWFQDLDPVPFLEIAPLIVRVDTRANGGVIGGLHRHNDFYSLYIVRRGRGMHTVGDVPYAVARGDVFVMTPGQTHRYAEFQDLVMEAFYFQRGALDPSVVEALAEAGGLTALAAPNGDGPTGRRMHLPPNVLEEVEAITEEIRAERRAGTRGGAAVARLLFARLLIRLARLEAASGSPEAPRSPSESQTVAAALRTLEERFAEPIRIEQLAAELFVSPDRLAKLFYAVMGRTPREYLTYLRLERAKALLSEDDLPVGDVGARCGFLEAAYFARAFRAATGMPPSEFRRRTAQEAGGS